MQCADIIILCQDLMTKNLNYLEKDLSCCLLKSNVIYIEEFQNSIF